MAEISSRDFAFLCRCVTHVWLLIRNLTLFLKGAYTLIQIWKQWLSEYICKWIRINVSFPREPLRSAMVIASFVAWTMSAKTFQFLSEAKLVFPNIPSLTRNLNYCLAIWIWSCNTYNSSYKRGSKFMELIRYI